MLKSYAAHGFSRKIELFPNRVLSHLGSLCWLSRWIAQRRTMGSARVLLLHGTPSLWGSMRFGCKTPVKLVDRGCPEIG
jgi:hypothetical protein